MAPINAIDMEFLRDLSVVKLTNIDQSREDRDGLRRFVLIKGLLCDRLGASEEPLEYTEEPLEYTDEDVKLGQEIWLEEVLDGLLQEEDADGYVCISRPTSATTMVTGEELPLPSSSSEETTTITTDEDGDGQTTITTITTITTPIVAAADVQTPQLRPTRSEDVFPTGYREDDFTDLDDSIVGRELRRSDTCRDGFGNDAMDTVPNGEDHNHTVIRRGDDDDEDDEDEEYSPPSSPTSLTRGHGHFSGDVRPRFFHRYCLDRDLLAGVSSMAPPNRRFTTPIVVRHTANDLDVPYTAFADAGLFGWCDEKAACRTDPFPTPRNERSPVFTEPSNVWFV